MLFPSGNPFKCHEEVLYLQPLIPPKRFDIFSPLTGRCSEGLGAFFFFAFSSIRDQSPDATDNFKSFTLLHSSKAVSYEDFFQELFGLEGSNKFLEKKRQIHNQSKDLGPSLTILYMQRIL